MPSAIVSRLIPFALLAIALAGCAAGPDYVRPDAPEADTFKEAPTDSEAHGARWNEARPADTAPAGEWWRVFNAPELDQLMARQREGTPTIAQAEAQYRAAQALLQQAQSGLYPSLGVNAGAQRSGTGEQAAASQFTSSLAASWTPDLWGSVRRSIEANDADAQAGYARLAGVRLSSEAQLATAWLQLVMADQQLAQLQQSEAALQEALQITQHRLQAGTVSDGAVAQAESQLKSLQSQLIEKRLARSQLEHAIAAALGLAPAALTLPAEHHTPTLPDIPAGLPSDLLQRRPDIAAAERDMAAANARIGIARTAYFPSLTLSANAGSRASVIDTLLTAPTRLWAFGTAILLNLLDGGERRAREEQAQAQYDASVSRYRQIVLTAFQEVEDLLAARRLLAQQAEAQSTALDAARRAEEIATNQYRNGTVSYLEVLTAQNTRLAAENTLWGIRSRQYSTAVALITALGGGWHTPETFSDTASAPATD